jgi:hypothetical protein
MSRPALNPHWLRWLIGLALIGLATRVASAASMIEQYDGPRWNPSGKLYTFGVCADTSTGEAIDVQYTLDNADLTDPPPTGNGLKSPCTLTGDSTCPQGRYWLCSIPNTRGVTFKYRFYVMSAANQYYGLVTPQNSFTTIVLAVTTEHFEARTFSASSVILVAAVLIVGLGLGLLVFRRVRHLR